MWGLMRLSPSPSFVGLTEFKMTEDISHYEWVTAQVTQGKFYLCAPREGMSSNGVAALVSPDLSPSGPPHMEVVVRGRVIYFDLKMFPLLPPVRTIVLYGTNQVRDRPLLERCLEQVMKGPTLLMGDMNAITQWDDVTGVSMPYASRLLWPWLRHMEETHTLIDLVGTTTIHPFKTRNRGYAGQSRLDRIYGSKDLFPLLQCSTGPTNLVGSDGAHLSDHDPVLVQVSARPWCQEPRGGCIGWTGRHIKQYRKMLGGVPIPEGIEDMQPECLLEVYQRLEDAMKEAARLLMPKPPSRRQERKLEWIAEIKYMLRLQRRNPKLFFRRLKSSNLMPMVKPNTPLSSHILPKLMSVSNPFDPEVVRLYKASQVAPPLLHLPTDEDLRRLSRVPRSKSAGPDGIHPYLVYQLPDRQFHVIVCCIRSILQGGEAPRSFWDACVIGLFKGKPDWDEPAAWRPVSMPTAGYRLLMRWVVSQLQPYIQGYLDTRQYGRRGASTAMATMELLGWQRRMEATTGCYGALLDVQNAFSSVPHALLFSLLERVDVPECFRQIIANSMTAGMMVPQGGGAPFLPTSGVRQGCPLSVLLFTLFYDLLLQQCRLPCSAYVDDLAILAPSKAQLVEEMAHLQGLLDRMGMQLNLAKCICLGPEGGWIEEVQEWPQLQQVGGRIAMKAEAMHLGHPICFPFDHSRLMEVVATEGHASMQDFLNKPLPLSARITVLNHVLIPQLLYRLECLPPHEGFHQCVLRWTKELILGLSDIPSFVNPKTIFSPKRFGLGCAYFPTLMPQRCLDVCHKFLRYRGVDPQVFPGVPYVLQCLQRAAICLGAEVHFSGDYSGVPPFETGVEHPLQGCPFIELPMVEVSSPMPGLYSDGSFDAERGVCASAVVLPDGRRMVLRPPGPPSSYKAEVYALCLAVDWAGQNDTIYTDSAATLAAVAGSSERVVLGACIRHIREGIILKDLGVQYVPGHQGILGNELADEAARVAQELLPPPKVHHPQRPWEVCYGGELCQPPHKTWAKANTPSHHPYDIHPVSWRFLRVGWWFKWLCGLVSAAGFDHPQSYWHNTPSQTPCLYCQQFHNRSVHGFVGLCESPGMPLVKAWLDAWGCHRQLLNAWRQVATERERFLLGKLVIPWGLWLHLQEALGLKVARQAVRHFQATILYKLKGCIPRFHVSKGHPRRRLNPWVAEDWLPVPRRPAARFPPLKRQALTH